MSARSRLTTVLAAARRPEHTGENRCVPCAIVNVAIAGLVAVGLAFVLVTPIGLLAFLACLAVIYLRGYLVPGTPELTQQYFPPWLLALFGKDEPIENGFEVNGRGSMTEAAASGPTTSGAATTGVGAESGTTGPDEPEKSAAVAATDPDDPLFAANVLARGEGTGVDLAPSFRAAWHDRIGSVEEGGVEPADLRSMFDAEDVGRMGEASFVLDSSASVRWESPEALLADVAAASLLSDRLAGWENLDRDERRAALTGLRLFLDRCPACGGAIARGEERVDPCCQRPHLVVDAACEECGTPIADAAVADSGGSAPVRARLLEI